MHRPHQVHGSGVGCLSLKASFPFVQWKPSHFLISPKSESGRQSLRPLGSLEPGLEVVMGAAGLQMRDKEEICGENSSLKKAIRKERKIPNIYSKVQVELDGF